MTLAPKDAESVLYARYIEPAKTPTDYIIGFRTLTGKLLAIHRTVAETLVWFQPPEPPSIDGVELQLKPSNGNSNINGSPAQRATSKDLAIPNASREIPSLCCSDQLKPQQKAEFGNLRELLKKAF
ncbi:hypothetical protein [Ruegeria profundi]|uniref:Uncharacterized protein n=1 Tax=Ruegeria profundi TaxID=1685378 RepID=A0A0X3TMV5_9RHOB|nr:hypothetical protein [Ruegeria profundi]KUJ77078.1 hypothetical protein AVO44_18715 [Ruegeria profundi]